MRKLMTAFFVSMSLCAADGVPSPRFDCADLRFSSSLTLPSDSAQKERTLSAGAGVKLCASDLFFVDTMDARCYVTLARTGLGSLGEAGVDGAFGRLGEPRFGIGVSLFGASVPVQVKVGANSYARSVSRLKNPSPSSVGNPLKKSFSFSPGVGASLPTLTSSAQPVSAALCAQLPPGRFAVPLKIEAFITEEKNGAVSVGVSRSLGTWFSVRTALTGARFFAENSSSLLKKANAQFDGDFLCAGVWETSVQSPFLKANVSLALHQSPYGRAGFWLKADARAAYRSLLVDASFFALPTASRFPSVAPLVGIDASIVRTLQSASVNPQVVLFLSKSGASSLRMGLFAGESVKVCATKGAETLCVGKARLGVAYESPSFEVKLDLAAANVLLAGSPPNKSSAPETYCSASVGGNVSGDVLRASFSAALKYYPPYNASFKEKKTVALNVSVVPGRLSWLTVQSGCDVAVSGAEKKSASVDSAVSVKMKSKRCTSSVKCAISVPF